VVAFRWLGGKAKAQGREKGWGALACHHRHVFQKFIYVFLHSVSMTKVAGESSFYVLTYMNFYLFHFIYLFVKNMLTLILTYWTLSLSDTYGPYCITLRKKWVAKYTRMMMIIAFITMNSGLVLLIEGLCAQILYFRFEIIVGLHSHLLLSFFGRKNTWKIWKYEKRS